MSGGGKDDDAALWRKLRALDDDLLRADSPIEEVDRVLREAGSDPENVARRGAELAARLAKSRRLSWRDRARKRIEEMTAVTTRQLRLDLAGPELIAALDRARAHPALGGQMSAAFRNLKEGDMTDEERRDLLADMEAVIAMAEAEEDADGEEA